ncbi:shikimate dehydrogenase family protein [Lichenicoccus sp.]|uniref:shikimate dehydrogenase family protein n=1 Tax=Lichenicoccus sp. TaxID=2781899 RepID=UPI003D0D6412
MTLDRPTLFFIGVSTAQSSIMRIFPRWAKALGLGDCAIAGLDFALHDRPEAYRAAVKAIKGDPLARGALVTTHKIDLLAASADLLDELDPFAASQREVSCLSKRDGLLIGHAKDPVSAGLALSAMVPAGHWAETRAAALVMGAGGATTAITWNLTRPELGADRPSRIVVTDILPERLEALRRFHGNDIAIETVLTTTAAENDALLAQLPSGSLVVNATGLGKDRPGSPLSDAALFPRDALVWDLNYRGDLLFLAQAEAQAGAQAGARGLRINDGWTYFLHGWTQVIAEVFAVDIPTSGPRFEELSNLAGGPPRAHP